MPKWIVAVHLLIKQRVASWEVNNKGIKILVLELPVEWESPRGMCWATPFYKAQWCLCPALTAQSQILGLLENVSPSSSLKKHESCWAWYCWREGWSWKTKRVQQQRADVWKMASCTHVLMCHKKLWIWTIWIRQYNFYTQVHVEFWIFHKQARYCSHRDENKKFIKKDELTTHIDSIRHEHMPITIVNSASLVSVFGIDVEMMKDMQWQESSE